jgi:hypothetical protein
MPAKKRNREKELRDIEVALKRASLRAGEIARQTGRSAHPVGRGEDREILSERSEFHGRPAVQVAHPASLLRQNSGT